MAAILILDDNQACSATLKITLKSRGHEVSCTTDVQFVISPARYEEFDLLLISIAYGKAGGWDVFNHLARIIPQLPAMVYVMDRPATGTAAWIAKAAEAVIYETNQAARRCLGLTPKCNDGVKSNLTAIGSGEME
jgi:DNA-binding NtrC family response regulator